MSRFQVGRTRRAVIGAVGVVVAMGMVTGAAAYADVSPQPGQGVQAGQSAPAGPSTGAGQGTDAGQDTRVDENMDERTLAYIGHVDSLGGGRVVVLDAKTHAEVAHISTAGRPNGITAKPDGHFVYVATENVPGVQIIDTRSNSIVNQVEVGGGWANKVAFNAKADRAYVAQGSTGAGGTRGAVHVVDVATDKVIDTFKAGEWPSDIVLTPNDARAYVASMESPDISVVDLATSEVLTTVSVGLGSPRLALSPDGTKLFAASGTKLSVIDVETNTVARQLEIGAINGLALSPDGTRAYVSNVRTQEFGGVVAIVDTKELTVVGESPEVKVGKLAVSPDGASVYVLSQSSDVTTVLDAATGAVRSSFAAPEKSKPSAVALLTLPRQG